MYRYRIIIIIILIATHIRCGGYKKHDNELEKQIDTIFLNLKLIDDTIEWCGYDEDIVSEMNRRKTKEQDKLKKLIHESSYKR